MTQFQPIITNAPTKDILAYNKLIAMKPKNGNLAEKIAAQRQWKNEAIALLDKIRKGCHVCGEEDIIPNTEAFEISGMIVCDECADEVFEENSQFGVGA